MELNAGGAGAEGYIGFLREGLEELVTSRVAILSLCRALQTPNVAAEIVALEPAVIIASAVDTALAAEKTTSTIPIVSGALADAEHLGLVAMPDRVGT